MTSRPLIGRTRIGLLNTMFSASNALTWAGVALPDSRSLRKGCIVISPMSVTVPVTQRSSSLPGRIPCEVELPRFLVRSFHASLDMHFPLAVPDFDGFDGVFKRPFQNAPADGPEHEAEHPSLEVLAVAYDDNVNVGRAVGLTS